MKDGGHIFKEMSISLLQMRVMGARMDRFFKGFLVFSVGVSCQNAICQEDIWSTDS